MTTQIRFSIWPRNTSRSPSKTWRVRDVVKVLNRMNLKYERTSWLFYVNCPIEHRKELEYRLRAHNIAYNIEEVT